MPSLADPARNENWRPHMTMDAKTRMDMEQVTVFRQSLAEPIAWCTTRTVLSDPERYLRTLAMYPDPPVRFTSSKRLLSGRRASPP